MTAFVTYNGRLLIKDAKFNDIPLILELMDVYPILGKIFSHKLLDFVFNRKRNMFVWSTSIVCYYCVTLWAK